MVRVVTILGSAALGILALLSTGAGCSATGATDEGPLPEVDSGPADPGVKLPPKSDGKEPNGEGGVDETPSDGGGVIKPKDGSAPPPKDATAPMDSGPMTGPDPIEGDTCPMLDKIGIGTCGFCGTHKTVCEKKPDMSLKWSAYSGCEGEHGVCVGGTVTTEGCNNCGTRTTTCGSSSCMWSTGACSVAAGVGCTPGTWELINAGCPTPGVYRARLCKADCTPEVGFTGCIAPPTSIDVGPTAASVSSTIAILAGSIAKISSGSCPATPATGTSAPYAYTQIHNPLTKEVKVSIYNSQAPSGGIVETALAVYMGDLAPTTSAARKDCMKASSSGTVALTGDAKFAALTDTKQITIPAGGTVTVYTVDDTTTNPTGGPVKVNVKTETIAQ